MTRDELKEHIASSYSEKLTLLDTGRCEPIYQVQATDLLSIAKSLKEDETLKFDYLCNLNGTDTGERLEVSYQLASISNSLRLDLKVILEGEKPAVDSVQEIWPAANWYEREMWELYGINVNNHGSLERFLLPDDWDQGFPMRKDWDAPDFIRMPEFKQ
ncbi:MAG: NADH-quinone oxidoreductase subunit C [candidate division Zixibacteria bacterium]